LYVWRFPVKTTKAASFIFGFLVFGDGIENLFNLAEEIQSGLLANLEKKVRVEGSKFKL
jgi:hypothetical protein